MGWKDGVFFFGVAMMIVGMMNIKDTPYLALFEMIVGAGVIYLGAILISQRPTPRCCGQAMTFHRSEQDHVYKCDRCGRTRL